MKLFTILQNIAKKIISALARVSSLESWQGSIGDYIVEQGTSGIWTYRKWNSGVSECFAKQQTTITSWSSWGSLYEASPYPQNIAFPSGLFTEIPVCLASVSSDSSGGLVSLEMGVVSKTTISYLIPLRPNSGSNNVKINYFIHAIGKWK